MTWGVTSKPVTPPIALARQLTSALALNEPLDTLLIEGDEVRVEGITGAGTADAQHQVSAFIAIWCEGVYVYILPNRAKEASYNAALEGLFARIRATSHRRCLGYCHDFAACAAGKRTGRLMRQWGASLFPMAPNSHDARRLGNFLAAFPTMLGPGGWTEFGCHNRAYFERDSRIGRPDVSARAF
jgi:hypothetical protein